MTLTRRLNQLDAKQPSAWCETGANARHTLHGLLRYPAMMVPRMQGDILDAILKSVKAPCHVVDPFVGSGTVMTEAVIRGLDFTGVDINPLATLVCDAKVAVDEGANVEAAAQAVMLACRFDTARTVEVDFPNIEKWFDEPIAQRLSVIRRAIVALPDRDARKVMWTVLAETIREGSNSRTSTYKLHLRASDDRVDGEQVWTLFEENLRSMLDRVAAYRRLTAKRPKEQPNVRIICDDSRLAALSPVGDDHVVLITSPPYGDNQTTIPYGQFSYLAMQWIPREDLHPTAAAMVSNTHFLDTASLGGSLRKVADKAEKVAEVSPAFARMIEAGGSGKAWGLRKVSVFMADLLDAFRHVRASCPGPAHWVLTTGNRRASGMQVPLDAICREMVQSLGGRPVTALRRNLHGKRMPLRNNMGELMTTETTLVVEFT